MKIPKKLVAGLISAANSATPFVSSFVSEKIKSKLEKIEQEKKYVNQKHNGLVKTASFVLSLVGLVLATLAIKQSKTLLGIVGLLSVAAYIITILYCLEIINEKRHNVYKLFFILGDLLLVMVATLLFF